MKIPWRFVVAAIVVPLFVQTIAILLENLVSAVSRLADFTFVTLFVSVAAGVVILIKAVGWIGVAVALVYAPLMYYLLVWFSLAFVSVFFGKAL